MNEVLSSLIIEILNLKKIDYQIHKIGLYNLYTP